MSFKKNIIAFFVISILGTLGHFLYNFTDRNYLVGLFFPVNESTWEHLKLLFFPTIIYSVFEYILLKKKPQNYIPAVMCSAIFGMITIVVLFYTFRGILGYNVDFINISIYYISVIIMLFRKNKILNNKYSTKFANRLSVTLGLAITVLFTIWSYNPPNLGIFIPPMM